MHPHLERGHRRARDPGDFLVRQPFRMLQHEDLALLRGQVLERLLQRVRALHLLVLTVRPIGRRKQLVSRVERPFLSLPAPLLSKAAVPQNQEQPPRKLVGLAAAAALALLLGRAAPAPQPGPGTQARAGTRDSVLVRFVLYAPGARRVAVAGTFNQWDRSTALLVPAGTSGVWTTTLALPVGQHQYAFVVDGARWVVDPAAPAVDDGFGRRNSVVAVGAPGTHTL